jgi:hypothetical protein
MEGRRHEPIPVQSCDLIALKNKMETLKGKQVRVTEIATNVAKNKIKEGVITNITSNIFALKVPLGDTFITCSHTFIDISTGRITIEEIDEVVSD